MESPNKGIENASAQFEQFQIADLGLKNTKGKTQKVDREIIVNGKLFTMRGLRQMDPDIASVDGGLIERITIRCLERVTGEVLFSAGLFCSEGNEKIIVTTSIERKDEKGRLPLGFGRMMYAKILDYIATLPAEYQKSVIHEVQRAPFTEREDLVKLSEKRWNEIFLPLIEARAYEDRGNGIWEKIYSYEGISKSKEEGIPHENFAFADLRWQQENKGSEELFHDLVATHEVVINGKKILIDARRGVERDIITQQLMEVTRFYYRNSEDGKKALYLAIFCRDEKSGVDVTTSIEKTDREKILPVGFGRVAYEKLLDYIGTLPAHYNKNVIHMVTRAPWRSLLDFQKLTEERWDELFVPLLRARGYEQLRDGKWVRIYKNPSQ